MVSETVKDGSSAHDEMSFDPYGLSAEDRDFLDSMPGITKKCIVRKVDLHLIPLLTFLYLMSYIDRTNIGNVKIEGIMDDLDLRGNRYNVAVCIFFAPYCLLEIPSNWVLSWFKRPSLYIGGLVVAWGLVMTFSGLIQTYEQLIAVRFLLGVTEAGFYPGALLIIGKWYTKKELQLRIAVFYSASAAAGAFSGLLAYAISKLDGTAGYRGWRWIFIIEGAISVLGGVVCLLCLPDSPDLSYRWLSPEQIRFLNVRKLENQAERGGAKEESRGFPWKVLRDVFLDWQIYLMMVIYWSNAMPNYGLKFTMPQVIKNMGFTSANAQLLTIPPYFMGTVSALASSWIADRYSWRMPFIITGQTIIIISYAILFSYGPDLEHRVGECYFALVLACIGFYPILPGTNAWILSNLAGPSKRALGIAWLISIGNLGGIPGSFFFKESEAPRYPTAYGASMSVAAAGAVAAITAELIYKSINSRRDRKTSVEVRQTHSDEELEKMGDRSPLFRYTL